MYNFEVWNACCNQAWAKQEQHGKWVRRVDEKKHRNEDLRGRGLIPASSPACHCSLESRLCSDMWVLLHSQVAKIIQLTLVTNWRQRHSLSSSAEFILEDAWLTIAGQHHGEGDAVTWVNTIFEEGESVRSASLFSAHRAMDSLICSGAPHHLQGRALWSLINHHPSSIPSKTNLSIPADSRNSALASTMIDSVHFTIFLESS